MGTEKMTEHKCECGFICYSAILAEQHERRCKTGLSESEYKDYLRARPSAIKTN